MEKDETEDALPSDGRGALVRPGWSFTDKDDEARYRDARQKKVWSHPARSCFPALVGSTDQGPHKLRGDNAFCANLTIDSPAILTHRSTCRASKWKLCLYV